MGLWEFADKLNGSLPYKQLVSVGPLPGELGLISRREQILQVDAALQTQTNAPAALNQTILAAYKQMTASYQPNYTNAVIMLTAGVDNAPGDISAATLVRKLHGLFNPNRPVELIILMLGTKGNFPALEQIASRGRRRCVPGHQPDTGRQGVLRGPRPAVLPVRRLRGPEKLPPNSHEDRCRFLVNRSREVRVIFVRPGESGAPGLTQTSPGDPDHQAAPARPLSSI